MIKTFIQKLFNRQHSGFEVSLDKSKSPYFYNIKCLDCGYVERRLALLPFYKCNKCGQKYTSNTPYLK